jgi:hypothetical protein
MRIYGCGENFESEKPVDIGYRNKSWISTLFYRALDKLGIYTSEHLLKRQTKKLHNVQSELEEHIEKYHQRLKDVRERVPISDTFRELKIKSYLGVLRNLERQHHKIDIILRDIGGNKSSYDCCRSDGNGQ